MITQSTSPSPTAMTLALFASRRLICLLVAAYGRGQGEVPAVLQLMTRGNTLKQQARPAVGRHDLACLVRRIRRERDGLVVIALAGDLPAENLCPPPALNPHVMTVHDYGVPAQARIRKLTDARSPIRDPRRYRNAGGSKTHSPTVISSLLWAGRWRFGYSSSAMRAATRPTASGSIVG